MSIPSRTGWGAVPVNRFPVHPGTPVVHSTTTAFNFTRTVTVPGPPIRIEPYTSTSPHHTATAEDRFTHRYGPVLAEALAADTRDDLGYQPYRANETGLVPPDPNTGWEPEFQPGCDQCGALDTRATIDGTGTRRLLCTGHRAAEWTRRYLPAPLAPWQEQALVDAFRRWGL